MSSALVEQCAGLPAPGTTLLIAVSGGCDSMVLLDMLRCSNKWPLQVYHLDHQLRSDSDQDAQLVRDYCQRHHIPAHVHSKNIAELAQQQKQGIEVSAREYRYRELEQIARDHHIDFICTAHHQDDHLESIVMHAMRGAGAHGLSGMREQRALGRCTLIRPLIQVSQQSLRDYAREHRLVWHEDSSNADTAFLRNHLRHQIIPRMARENPHFKSELLRQAEEKRYQVDVIEAIIDSEWLHCVSAAEISVSVLRDWSEDVRNSFWRRLLIHFELPLSQKNIQRFEDLLSGTTSKQVELGNRRFYRNQDRISWTQGQAPIEPVLFNQQQQVGSFVYSIEAFIPTDLKSFNANEACIKKDAIVGNLYLKNISAGESWLALGAPGHKNVFQYLSDKKFPIQERATLVVVDDDEGVLWIPGCTIAERVKAAPGDDCVLVTRK